MVPMIIATQFGPRVTLVDAEDAEDAVAAGEAKKYPFSNPLYYQVSEGERAQGFLTRNWEPLPGPPPTLVSIDPDAATEGDPDTLVTLTGTGFSGATVATVDGDPVDTTYVSATEVTITVPEASLAAAGTVEIGIVGIEDTADLTVS